MLRFLCAGFGESLHPDVLAELRALGVEGIRQDGREHGRYLLPDQCAALVEEVETAGLKCYFSVYNIGQLYELPRGTWVGLHNEPDSEGISSARYRFDLALAREVCEERGLALWAGEVSNLNDHGLTYLQEIRRALPDRVSVHWYPEAGKGRTVGHDGRSRAEEVIALKQVIGGRQFGVGEFGFHAARECRGWWLWRRCRQRSDVEAAREIRDEFVFWERAGAAFACLYQLHDGQGGDPLDRFGIRRPDGTWKIQAQAFRRTPA